MDLVVLFEDKQRSGVLYRNPSDKTLLDIVVFILRCMHIRNVVKTFCAYLFFGSDKRISTHTACTREEKLYQITQKHWKAGKPEDVLRKEKTAVAVTQEAEAVVEGVAIAFAPLVAYQCRHE